MEKRKTSIELMRFFGAAMVVFIHCRELIYQESILAQYAIPVVDFFFLLSGYFAMSDASKAISAEKEDSNEICSRVLPEACDSVKYVWNKAKALFSLYFFALILMFVVRTAQKDSFSLADTLKELFHFKWEFLMLHMLGFNHAPAFNTDYLLGPGWFVSSLMIALVPFYFLARRYGRTFSGVIAPVSMAVLYAYIIQTYGTLNVGNEIAFGAVMVGNIRAFAGLSTGAFVYRLNEWTKDSLKRKEGKVCRLFSVMDVISWLLAVSLFVFPKDVIPEPDMVFWMVLFSFILLNGVNDIGPVSSFLNHHATAVWRTLGKLSMYIYLLHMPIVCIWQKNIHLDAPILSSFIILTVAAAFSYVVMQVREHAISSR